MINSETHNDSEYRTAYEYYKQRIDKITMLDEDGEIIDGILNKSELNILIGKTVFNNTKSARNNYN